MKVDVIRKDSKEIVEKLKNLGFDKVLLIKDQNIIDITKDENTELKAYSGKDYDFVIRKGKAKFIYDLEVNNFLLNKGLCSKLKENKMIVIFSFSSLEKSENMFKVYKNLLINGKLCNDYGINCLYSSGSESTSDIKSFFQLCAFADEFGYNYKNMLDSMKSVTELI
jgi:RNase P/RNase MRP subunit p30